MYCNILESLNSAVVPLFSFKQHQSAKTPFIGVHAVCLQTPLLCT